MVRIFFISLLLFLSNLEKKAHKAIAKEYEVDLVILDVLEEGYLDGTLYSVLTDKGPKGYAFIGSSKSRYDDFEYLALLDSNFAIVKVKVLIYRENYGGEIGSTRWLRQFIGLKRTN